MSPGVTRAAAWPGVRYARRRKLVCVTLAFLAVGKDEQDEERGKKRREREKKETLRNGKGRSCHIPDFPVYLDA